MSVGRVTKQYVDIVFELHEQDGLFYSKKYNEVVCSLVREAVNAELESNKSSQANKEGLITLINWELSYHYALLKTATTSDFAIQHLNLFYKNEKLQKDYAGVVAKAIQDLCLSNVYTYQEFMYEPKQYG